MIFFPNAKINIGLHITRKRPDGFHELQTIFYPVPLQDALEMVTLQNGETNITVTGLSTSISPLDNSCYKAYLLLKENFSQLPPVSMHLHKTIPAGAGLGGGSADAAFTLLLLNKKYKLGLTENELLELALTLGSDCPFFIKNKPCYATGRGEILEEINLDLSAYKILIINPGIHVNTGWAFSQITPAEKNISLVAAVQNPVSEWKDIVVNDFELPIFKAHPELEEIKQKLYNNGAIYASMTGSGSTLFALYPRNEKPDLVFPSHYFIKEC